MATVLKITLITLLLIGDTGAHTQCSAGAIPQFDDVTHQAGIHFKHISDPTKRYISESMGGGVLVVDYDQDGWPDLYFTNAPSMAMMLRGEKAKSALYHNNRDGTFTDVTEKSGVAFPCAAMGGAVGDYNNDGWPDMIITCLKGSVLYRNNGDGTFTDVSSKTPFDNGRWTTGAAFADYDHDGYLDLAIAGYVQLDLNHLPQPGSATTCMYREIPVQCGPHGLKGGQDALYHNDVGRDFTDESHKSGVEDSNHYYGLGVLWGDFDGTRRDSLFIANDSTANYLYQNLGRGKFAEVGLDAGVAVNGDGKEQANMGVTAGDYLHTGRESLYVTTFSDEVKSLYRNDGNLQFTEVAGKSGLANGSLPLLGWGTVLADFDNDGWLDLFSVYGHVYPQVDRIDGSAGYREAKTLSINNRDGSFCEASALAGPALKQLTAARGLAAADLFNDGNLDAIIENLDGEPLILRNRGIPGRHWIEFELAGTQSNRSAIGAELMLKAGGMTQTQEIRSGGSYLSQSDLRAHFGIGEATYIDELEIHWPSGRIDKLHHLNVDHIFSVLEGSGVIDRRHFAAH
jgi:hypothetical protein